MITTQCVFAQTLYSSGHGLQSAEESLVSLRHGADDVGVSGVGDGECAHAEVLSAGGAKLDVVAGVVVHAGLGQHGVVLNLGLPAGVKERNWRVQKAISTARL